MCHQEIKRVTRIEDGFLLEDEPWELSSSPRDCRKQNASVLSGRDVWPCSSRKNIPPAIRDIPCEQGILRSRNRDFVLELTGVGKCSGWTRDLANGGYIRRGINEVADHG